MRVEEYGSPMYHAGDRVLIAYEPCDCIFTWVGDMNRFCGKEAKITHSTWSEGFETYVYFLDIDGSKHMWCINCFVTHEEDFDISPEEFEFILRG